LEGFACRDKGYLERVFSVGRGNKGIGLGGQEGTAEVGMPYFEKNGGIKNFR